MEASVGELQVYVRYGEEGGGRRENRIRGQGKGEAREKVFGLEGYERRGAARARARPATRITS